MSVLATPGYQLQPSAEQVALQTNYITNFDFLNQYLPDTYEKEFERYGNRSIASFLRLVGAELPSNSDLIKWAEQGRLHTKYVDCATSGAAGDDSATITVNDAGVTAIAIRPGQTVSLSDNATGFANKGIVTDVDTAAGTFDVAYYEAGGQTFPVGATLTVWIYGSEFKKGSNGMRGSLEAEDDIFENSPIIIKDKYAVNGSDMAQIGWVEITTENGATGYLWYLKSEHETRLRFEDYLETSVIEAVPAEAGSGVANVALNPDYGNKGSEGVFYVVNKRGNVWGAGNPTTLADWDTVISRLDKQGAIEENVIFTNRDFGFDIDDMLAAQNSYGAGGTSYGLFNNDKDMALNLGFTGFRRGYDFYKSDWKYLNDPTMRGGLFNGGANGVVGTVTGMLVPAGSTTVYDQILGKNAKRPFLHVRYRATATEDRRYKTWITGSAGGAQTSDLDAMEVHFLSERCVCTLGANNFFLFRYGN
ncbi:MAG: structural protein [Podoviridae sp. ctrTa16]|nr:MAG: structural protein [Podoviridae sp. ctrTa16]